MGTNTVHINEGPDLSAMGADMSISSPPRTTLSPLRREPELILVPATPTPPGPKTAGVSPSNSEIFEDADGDLQTKRRSMYRSPGTSSSPDLATLLRKAKEHGGVIVGHSKRDKRQETVPPLPNLAATPITRQRSGTSSIQNSPYSSSPPTTPGLKAKSRSAGPPPSSLRPEMTGSSSAQSSDWVLTSPRSRSKDSRTVKQKSSVRDKTSAFFGKIMGGNTVRERSKTDAPAPNSLPQKANLFDAFTAPPLPPLPSDPQRTPVASHVQDVFSDMDDNKPLPPIMLSPSRPSESEDDHSMVVVEKPSRSSSPESEKLRTPVNKLANKRRSMSVGEFELKNAMNASALTTPLPRTPLSATEEGPGWDKMLSEFEGELQQLDSSESALDLKDPSTPARRAAAARTNSGAPRFMGPRPPIKTTSSAPPPTFSVHPPGSRSTPSTPLASGSDTFLPPRSASHHASAVRPGTSPKMSPAGRPAIRPRNGNSFGPIQGSQLASRDTARLRMQHRTAAASSEPSLLNSNLELLNEDQHRSNSASALGTEHATSSETLLQKSAILGETSSDMDIRAKELAEKCWTEDEEFLAKEKIAEWLGGMGRINKVALHHYIQNFDFANMRLDNAFRRLCAKLFLKAETQQVDRILEEFSNRYWDCNPGGVYGSASVVHAVSYSLLLLNTDLHVAELSTRMSRNQFTRNTLMAVQSQLQPPPPPPSTLDLTYDDCSSSVRSPSDGLDNTHSPMRNKRSGSIASWNSMSRETIMSGGLPGAASSGTLVSSATNNPTSHNGSNAEVHSSGTQTAVSSTTSFVYGKNWENEMESLLKDMYNAIKNQQILQPLGSIVPRSSMSALSPGPNGMLRHRNSLRGPPDRLATLKRGSIRGFQTLLGQQNGASPYSSNSSIDGRVSPSPSFATSNHDGMSSSTFLTPALGFASNLSHTIIREAQEDDDSLNSQNSGSTNISITDEELALLGAPWAKEGMLCRKQYWESTGKRAKDKAWMDVFVVIHKGELDMFIFGESASSGAGAVGGGNWLDNAHSVGAVHLSHSLAHSLPPPGYNRQRPHCMVLTLSSGGVYFFQAGTEELVSEWVSTCNYWAARTSKEPLAGGVSNMEYGWNRIDDPSYNHGRSVSDNDRDNSDSLSVRSGRSTRSKFGWRGEGGAATMRAPSSPYADKLFINDWKPPLPPTVSSIHDEETQLEALKKHVITMKKDLNRHSELREPMSALFQPRSPNALKSLSNWEKKSSYLLAEIVKYDSYIDSLEIAMSLRLKRRGEKALERALLVASPEEDDESPATWMQETIMEGEEPPPTPAFHQSFTSTMNHRRERAESS